MGKNNQYLDIMHTELPPEAAALQKKAINQCLQTLLPQTDALSLIVTGHLYVEHWLEWLLRASISRPEKLLGSINLTFAEKLAVAESLGLLRNNLAEATGRLNKIRNHIVHNLEYQIPQKDLQLLASFAPDLTKKKQLLLNKIGSPKIELVKFCPYFAGYVVGYVFGRRNAKSYLKAALENSHAKE